MDNRKNEKPRPRVIKKSRVRRSARSLCEPQRTGAGMTVRTEETGGDVTGLVVRCACGAEARIECVYGPPAPPGGKG